MDATSIKQNLSTERNKLSQVEPKISKNSSDKSQNTNNITKNSNDISANTSAQQDTSNSISTISGQIANVQTQKSGVQAEISRVQNAINNGSEDDAEYSANQEKLQDLNLSLEDLNKSANDFEAQKTEQESLLQEQQAEGNSLSEQSTTLNEEKTTLEEQSNSLEKNRNDIKFRITSLEEALKEAEANPSEENSDKDFIDKAKNIYKNGINFNDNLSLNIKNQKLNYSIGQDTNIYAGLNGFGANYSDGQFNLGGKMTYGLNYDLNAGYSNGNLSITGGYGSYSGVKGGLKYKSDDGKLNLSVEASQQNWGIGGSYKFSNDWALSMNGNHKEFMLGLKHNI